MHPSRGMHSQTEQEIISDDPVAYNPTRHKLDMIEWIAAHRNSNTQSSYSRAQQLFVSWCASQQPPLPSYPPTPEVVASYLRQLVMMENKAYSTAVARVSALSDWVRYDDDVQPVGQSKLVQQMLACLRPHAKERTHKVGIATHQLRRMVHWLFLTQNGLHAAAQALAQPVETSSAQQSAAGSSTGSIITTGSASSSTTRTSTASPARAHKQRASPVKPRSSSSTGVSSAASAYLDHRDIYMFLLGMVCMMRGSEIARLEANDVRVLQLEIAGKQVEILEVHVHRASKNDKERKGHQRIVQAVEPDTDNTCICPVRWHKRYMSQWHHKQQVKLFHTAPDAAGHSSALSRSTPNGRLHVWLVRIGVRDADRYGFHSLRRGGASSSQADGSIPIHLLMRHGNWASNAVLCYVDDPIEQRLRVADAILTPSRHARATQQMIENEREARG